MDKAAQPQSSVFSWQENTEAHGGRFRAPHLKPLSKYSRVIACDSKAALHCSTNHTSPFINIKIDLINRSLTKRKLDDSGLDDSFETPAKKPFSPVLCSPDLGCFLDYRDDLVSPATIVKPPLLEGQGSVNSQLHQNQEEHGQSQEWGPGLSPHTSIQRKLMLLAFDNDVNDIKRLNPSCSESAGGRPGAMESRRRDAESAGGSSGVPNKPDLRKPAQRRSSEERYDEEEDGAYLTQSDPKHLNVAGRVSQPRDAEVPQLTHTITSPLLRTGSVETPVNEFVFESSVCDGVTEKPQVCIEKAEGEDEGRVNDGGEVSSFIHTQVKSVVSVPNRLGCRNKAAAEEEVDPTERQRPKLFIWTEEWERKKQLYVDSVTRELKEAPPPAEAAGRGAVSEMMNLLLNVSQQEYGVPGRRWQHPSDLTRCNYQQWFGNETPRMSLQEWWTRNGPGRNRFKSVP